MGSAPMIARPSRFPAMAAFLFAAAVACATAVPARADDADSSLAATTLPPWNPPRAVPASAPWETVVRFPGRLASLPIAALGQATRCGLLAAEQGFYVQRVLYFFRGVPVPIGAGPAGLGDRTGLGAGVHIAPPLGPVKLEALFDASLKSYTRGRASFGVPAVKVTYAIDQRPNERFFGFGMDTHKGDEGRYGLKQERVALQLAARRGKPNETRETVAAWAGPRWSRLTQGFGSDDVSIVKRFPGLVTGTLERQIEHLTYGARAEIDRRGGAPHWSHGWRASAEAERFDRPLVASPSRAGSQFTRYQYLAEAGVSAGRDPRTVRLTLQVTDNEMISAPARFLVSDFARLGGASGLAGFEPHRFHDLDAMNLRAAYIWPLAQHFEMDVHGDAGGVFTDLQHELRPNRLRQSAGLALRGRTATAVIMRLGLDASPETTRFVFSMGTER